MAVIPLTTVRHCEIYMILAFSRQNNRVAYEYL